MQLAAIVADSARHIARHRLHRAEQRRQIVAHQPAHRPRFAGQSIGNAGYRWYLVDLPGYGYARVSKNERGEFSKLITDYVFRSEKMHFLFVLVDSRLEPQAIDLRFIRLLGEHGIPFGIVFTKTDKLSRNQLESSVARYKKQLLTEWEELPPLFFASSAKRTGREEILAFIDKCLKDS